MIGREKLLAVITARGGSKRLPRKNVLMFAGKPLIAWSIEAGLQSRYVDRVIVSTDDEEIAEISRSHGAEVPFLRPLELSNDTASSTDVIRHSVKTLETNGDEFGYILNLQPTSPLRTFRHIDEAATLMIQKEANGVIGVTEVDHPIEWTNILPQNLSMDRFISKNNQKKRCQDFPRRYCVNGAIYLCKKDSVMKEDGVFFKKGSYAYKMDPIDSVDIDTKKDFLVAETFLKYSQSLKLSSI